MRITENTKGVILMDPANYASGFDGVSRIMDISEYENVVIYIDTGASSLSDSQITIEALDGSTPADNPTAVPFKYRYNEAPETDDNLGAYVQAAAAGFKMVASKAGSSYAIELKDADLLNAGQNGFKYFRVKAVADTAAAQVVSVRAVGYNSRRAGMVLEQSVYAAS